MIHIINLEKSGRILYKIYVGIGTFAMGCLAFSVIFTVIMRYFFSLSWRELEELMNVIFAFTTFWGMGICILSNEHVSINIVYDIIPPAVKRWVTLINYSIVLIVNSLFFYFSCQYINKIGNQLSKGMMIPMLYIYTIMPVCSAICAVCIILKMIEAVKAPVDFFQQNHIRIDV